MRIFLKRFERFECLWTVRIIAMCIVAGASFVLLDSLLDRIIDRIEPVGEITQFELIKRDDGITTVQIYGEKHRDCLFVADSQAGYALIDGQWVEVPFQYLDDVSPGSSRPPGMQDFGVWQWGTDKGAQVMVRVLHQCDDATITTTMGPVKVADND